MADQETLSQLLSRRKGKLGIDTADLARRIEQPPHVVAEWEAGTALPADGDLAKLAIAITIPASLLREAINKSGLLPVITEPAEKPHPSEDQPSAQSQIPTPSPGTLDSTSHPTQESPTFEFPVIEQPDFERATISGTEADLTTKDQGRSIRSWISSLFDRVGRVFSRRSRKGHAPVVATSYVEDPEQLTTYRIRLIFTVAGVITLFLLLSWAMEGLGSALSDLWDTFLTAVS